jgi:hypothetical protein
MLTRRSLVERRADLEYLPPGSTRWHQIGDDERARLREEARELLRRVDQNVRVEEAMDVLLELELLELDAEMAAALGHWDRASRSYVASAGLRVLVQFGNTLALALGRNR